MAFPVVADFNTTDGTSASATPVVNLPANIAAGNLLLVLIRVAVGGSIGWPDADWHELFDASSDASDDQMAMAWRKATGSEGSTVTLSSTSGKFAAISWRITGAADPLIQPPQLSSVATGTSTTPDPFGHMVSPAKDYLWMWIGGWEGEQTSPPTGNPTNYGDNIHGASSAAAGAVTTNCRVASATRNLNGTTDDPGSWTISVSDDWTAYTVLVHPEDVTMEKWFPQYVARQHNFPPQMGVFNTN